MVPHLVTLAIVEEDELPATREWAARAGVDLEWDAPVLELRAVLTQQATGERFYLNGKLDGYRAVPPAWCFCDAKWGTPGQKSNFPAVGSPPGFSGSIFHSNGVICAPFNRLAYKDNGGPHGDWGGPAQWLKAGAGYVHAETLADMLSAVARDLAYSRGRMV
jgi:hypothetical protein